MAKKLKKVLSKEQKTLLIGMLIGDGTITNHPDYKITHSKKQLEYLEWKVKLLNKYNLPNGGIKEYVQKCGYNLGGEVIYVRVKTNSTIKALRRSVYIPNKTITRNLLNWLTPREIAIWYMDDGHINVNTSTQRSSIQHTIKIATCVDKNTVDVIIQYFIEKWGIKFRTFPEGKNTFSIATSTENDCKKFVKLIYKYIIQVPSLLYKIRNNFTKEEFIALQKSGDFRSAEHLFI
jgi:hypothetical protein